MGLVKEIGLALVSALGKKNIQMVGINMVVLPCLAASRFFEVCFGLLDVFWVLFKN